MKTYHEIRYNFRDTSYIPKFDELVYEGILEQLSIAEGNSIEHYTSQFSEDEIREKFRRLIKRHTRELEKDLDEDTS